MIKTAVDILILGAGLAGLRAASAALEQDASLSVLVVSNASEPAGSSFANRNNALGIQAPATDSEKHIFFDRVIKLQGTASLDPRLVSILAEEADEQFRYLYDLGFAFRRDASGSAAKFPGCFLPEIASAAVFDDLPKAGELMCQRVLDLGGRFKHDLSVVDLLLADDRSGRVCGAVFTHCACGSESFEAVHAGAVVCALGGPASLLLHDVSGPFNTGVSYGLMARAGARCVNTRFLQFLWHDLSTGTHVHPGSIIGTNARINSPNGREITFPAYSDELSAQRRNHCPASYTLEDGAYDAFLAENADADEVVTIKHEDGRAARIIAGAHAGNGGAAVDEHGRTNVPGLYAVGECAGGMHGADRIGGAMIAAAQVFGRRAGIAAAREAKATEPASIKTRDDDFPTHTKPCIRPSFVTETDIWLRTALTKVVGLRRSIRPESFVNEVKDRMPAFPKRTRMRLRLASALQVVHELHDISSPENAAGD